MLLRIRPLQSNHVCEFLKCCYIISVCFFVALFFSKISFIALVESFLHVLVGMIFTPKQCEDKLKGSFSDEFIMMCCKTSFLILANYTYDVKSECRRKTRNKVD